MLRIHQAAHSLSHIPRIIRPVGTVLVFRVVGIVGIVVAQGAKKRAPCLRILA